MEEAIFAAHDALSHRQAHGARWARAGAGIRCLLYLMDVLYVFLKVIESLVVGRFGFLLWSFMVALAMVVSLVTHV